MRKMLGSQRGFTLVEMLVAVGIMAILAGVAVPLVTGVTGTSQTKAAAAELSNVQSAVDTMMAALDLDAIVPVAAGASNMANFPDITTASATLFPTYMRTATTKGTYSVTTTGQVSQDTTGY